MPRPDDPNAFTPEQRLDELASIFAGALLRVPKRTRATLAPSKHRDNASIQDSCQKALEVSAPLSPDPLGA